MKALSVCLFLLVMCVSFATADVPPTFEEMKAQLEAEITPTLVLELNDEVASELRSNQTIPEELLFYFPNAVYEPLLTVPVNPEHEVLWRAQNLHRWFIVRDIAEQPSRSSLSAIESMESVESANFSNIQIMDLTPMDSGNFNTYAMNRMQATQAWDQQIGSDEVVVTTIDTGCEVTHPDLQQNLRVNPGEDLNGNGFWDASDVNGIDDDSNGYVDDIMGWDFVSATVAGLFQAPGEDYGPRDNRVWPDIVGHGTHVAGTTASTTNNSIGVPSASWNVSNMPLRAGYAYNFIFIILGVGDEVDFIAAIQYAAENGSDIISISFGGTGSSPAYQSVIDYARSLDVLIFASAGNSDNQVVNYPAGYNNVVSVAATDANDVRASFSTYGSWVDIAAPGVAIWSTVPGASYASYDGTSMASPNSAAVAALVKSHNPSMTAADLEQFILNGCDNIDAQNPGYIGLLGAGRVNALNSLNMASLAYPPSATPNIDMVPLISPTSVSAGGGSFGYNVTISNNTGSAQTFDAWTNAMLPNGSLYGPILAQTNYNMAAGATSQFTLQVAVPGGAPAGLYRFMANIGSLNGPIWDSDRLFFTKNNVAATSVVEDWASDRWPEISGDGAFASTLPTQFEVGKAYPNPFNAMTTLNVRLPETADLSVVVFDVMGRQAASIANGSFSAGNHEFSVNASTFSSGMYFIRASVSGKLDHTQKIMLVK
jgi:subtilisin family serine protease